jgi:hypothetical protein
MTADEAAGAGYEDQSVVSHVVSIPCFSGGGADARADVFRQCVESGREASATGY